MYDPLLKKVVLLSRCSVYFSKFFMMKLITTRWLDVTRVLQRGGGDISIHHITRDPILGYPLCFEICIKNPCRYVHALINLAVRFRNEKP